MTYGFVKYTAKSGRRRTHSFHEERYTEEINLFLINENVDSALRDLSQDEFFRVYRNLCYFVDKCIVYTESSRKGLGAEFTARLITSSVEVNG
jgi:hypothetical protein